MIPIQAHHTAYHEKYPSKRLSLLMQRSIGQIQAFPFDWLTLFWLGGKFAPPLPSRFFLNNSARKNL